MSETYVLKITPRGVVYAHRSLEERLHFARVELAKITLIIRSEIRARIFEKMLGVVFLAIEPIMMACVYYVLTFIILGATTSAQQFITIYVSVVGWRWMSKTVDGSPSLFPSYATILKQTNFSVTSLVLCYMGVEFFNFLISFAVLIVVCTAFGYPPNAAYIFLIFPMIAQASIIVLLTVVFSSIGVFFRDLQGFLSSMTGVWFYLSPGIYPVDRVPERFLWVYNINPFAHILPAYRRIMMDGAMPDIPTLLLIAVVASACAAVALAVLRHVRRNFFSFI